MSSVYRKDRKDGYGGVFLAVKNDLISEEITDIEKNDKLEVTCVKILLAKDCKLIVGALYRPPNSDIEYAQDVIAFLEKVVNKHPKAVHWFAGDYNLSDINWETQSIESSQNPRALNQLFLDFSFKCKLEQKIDQPTRDDNIPDLFLTNRPSLINKVRIEPGLSDHDVVYVESNVRPVKIKPVP